MAHSVSNKTGPDSAIAATIARAAGRVRFLRARQFAANGLMAGSGIAAIALLAERFRLLEAETFAPELLLLPPLVGLAIGAVWGATRAVPPLALLKHLETRLDLKERLSTAFLLPSNSTDPFLSRQRADAEAHTATDQDLRKALPYTPVPRRVYYAVGAVGAVFLLWFLPTLPLFQSPAERAEKASLKRDGERLERIAKKIEVEADMKRLDTVKAASLKLAKLGAEMQEGRLSRQKAMMQAAKLTEEMKQAQQTLAQQSAPKSLPSAARDMRKSLASAAGQTSPTGENKSGEPNAENNKLNAPQGGPKDRKQDGKTVSPSREAMNRAVDAMAKDNAPSLAEQLAKMADSVAANGPETEAGRQEMAGQVSDLANALKNTSYAAASQPLKEAADALKSGDKAKAAEKLREAARKIADSAKNSDTAQAMNKMADALSGQGEGEATEGEGFQDSGEGQDGKDAFNKNGQMKSGHVHTAECLKPGGT